jgi:ATP synthase protein I
MVPDRPGARYLRTILSQLLVLLLAVPVLLAIADRGSALSLLLGGSCALLPQALFALQMRAAARESAARAARLGLLAEAWKFLLSVALFAVVFALLKPSEPLLVFAGFGLVWAVQVVENVRLVRRAD